MADQELMVEFKRGTSEEAARAVVARLGGTVRRRMRTDGPEIVMLLVRPGTTAATSYERDPEIARVEVNTGGFRPME